ncbi:MAG: polyprenyl synthetase family protein [Provencibacterium sp.]|jgi:geranylgeranyl diphosphate synthase type II|nr:polyprenyl synthetase family protein [Provencibacterium sp.]
MVSKEYMLSCSEYREAVERQLEKSLPVCRQPYRIVVDAMRYCTLGAGKRMRAMLCLEFCRQSCGDYERALPFAAALEMMHAYSLIHDDLPCMDDDALRRGKPSCHIRFGEANALLAGDALLTASFTAALSGGSHPQVGSERALQAAMTLAGRAGVDGMIGGQVMDLAAEKHPELDDQTLHLLYSLKTGALIRAACEIGAIVGGAGQDVIRLGGEFAAHLGLAFQIVDDILDVTADEQTLGKPVGSDEASGKTTYAIRFGIERARLMAQDSIRRARAVLAQLPGDGRFLEEICNMVLERDH